MRYVSLVVLALLVIALAGCSRHSSTAARNNDLGIIEGGKSSDHTLADGRVCTITSTFLANGDVSLTTKTAETNAAGVIHSDSLVLEVPSQVAAKGFTYGFDSNTLITVKLALSQ